MGLKRLGKSDGYNNQTAAICSTANTFLFYNIVLFSLQLITHQKPATEIVYIINFNGLLMSIEAASEVHIPLHILEVNGAAFTAMMQPGSFFFLVACTITLIFLFIYF